MKSKAFLVASLAAAAVAAACATGRAVSADDPFGSRPGEPNSIRVEVRNLNWNEARLFAVSGGRRIRMGTVGGNQDAVYTLDWDFTLPLVIEVDLVAGPDCTTREIQVDPGDIIQLQIESNFGMTRFCR